MSQKISPHPNVSIGQIRTSRPPEGIWRNTSSISYGGTTFYGQSEKDLAAVLASVEDAIVAISKIHLCLIKQVLRSYVGQLLKESVPERFFGAVLGRCLRMGKLECLPCLTLSGKTRRIYVHSKRLSDFEMKVDLARKLLNTQIIVSVGNIQNACFPERASGTWFMSQQIAEYLAYKGHIVYADNDLFSLPKVLVDASRSSHR
jgi:hypothetical protein